MMILILTLVAILGAIMVSLGRPLAANVLWFCAQPGLALYNYNNNEIELAAMFTIYSLIAVYGIWNLKFRKRQK